MEKSSVSRFHRLFVPVAASAHFLAFLCQLSRVSISVVSSSDFGFWVCSDDLSWFEECRDFLNEHL